MQTGIAGPFPTYAPHIFGALHDAWDAGMGPSNGTKSIVPGHARIAEYFYTMSNLNILWCEWFIQDKAYSRKTKPYNKIES